MLQKARAVRNTTQDAKRGAPLRVGGSLPQVGRDDGLLAAVGGPRPAIRVRSPGRPRGECSRLVLAHSPPRDHERAIVWRLGEWTARAPTGSVGRRHSSDGCGKRSSREVRPAVLRGPSAARLRSFPSSDAEMRSGQQADRAKGTDSNEGPAGLQDGGPEARAHVRQPPGRRPRAPCHGSAGRSKKQTTTYISRGRKWRGMKSLPIEMSEEIARRL